MFLKLLLNTAHSVSSMTLLSPYTLNAVGTEWHLTQQLSKWLWGEKMVWTVC